MTTEDEFNKDFKESLKHAGKIAEKVKEELSAAAAGEGYLTVIGSKQKDNRSTAVVHDIRFYSPQEEEPAFTRKEPEVLIASLACKADLTEVTLQTLGVVIDVDGSRHLLVNDISTEGKWVRIEEKSLGFIRKLMSAVRMAVSMTDIQNEVGIGDLIGEPDRDTVLKIAADVLRQEAKKHRDVLAVSCLEAFKSK